MADAKAPAPTFNKGDRAVIDWYPLAGQTLTFDFRIVEIHVPSE